METFYECDGKAAYRYKSIWQTYNFMSTRIKEFPATTIKLLKLVFCVLIGAKRVVFVNRNVYSGHALIKIN
jgi:hypothetical protein